MLSVGTSNPATYGRFKTSHQFQGFAFPFSLYPPSFPVQSIRNRLGFLFPPEARASRRHNIPADDRFARPAAQLLQRERLPRRSTRAAPSALAPLRVGQAHHRHLPDRRVFPNRLLDLQGGDLYPLADGVPLRTDRTPSRTRLPVCRKWAAGITAVLLPQPVYHQPRLIIHDFTQMLIYSII